MEKIIKWGTNNPRKLFLIDGLGAFLSAFLLGVVLVELHPVFGIPPTTLYFLAVFPCIFVVYDFYCLVKKPLRIGVFLKGISMMNMCYCILSLGLAIYHFQELTSFGWIYILLEIVLIFILASLEYKVAKELKN